MDNEEVQDTIKQEEPMVKAHLISGPIISYMNKTNKTYI